MTQLLALALALGPLAQAQTSPPRVDPAYNVYLDALEEAAAMADPLDVSTNPCAGPCAQLDTGMVGFTDLVGRPLGKIFVTGAFPLMREQWFYNHAFVPSQEFIMTHKGGSGTVHTAELVTGWASKPYLDMELHYTAVPGPELTGGLDYMAPGITRYTFQLWQAGQVRGTLLREWHHVVGLEEHIVDHWVFRPGYSAPSSPGDAVAIRLGPVQYATTSAYFDAVRPTGQFYAQGAYTEGVGQDHL